MASNRTVAIKGDPIRKESQAAAAITPGQLIELASATTVQRHSTAGGPCSPMFALEDDHQGREIADNYLADTKCTYGVFPPGAEVNALLADGENAAVGDWLESNGSGDLQVAIIDSIGVGGGLGVVGQAMEAVDLSDSSGGDPATRRIKIAVR